MPLPENAKQVKQFLGLVGYYRKFVPCFSDIARPLPQLTQKNEGFNWTTEFDKCFHMPKDYLQEAPILRYPDPVADYILYTDAPKYAYAGVPTQSIDGTDHPVAYQWIIQRFPTKLDNPHQRSICHIHVNEEAQFLFRFSTDRTQK